MFLLLCQLLPLTRASTAVAQEGQAPAPSSHYWRSFTAGFVSSIIAHEAGHVGASLAMGSRPTFAMDQGRPTIFSGIDSRLEPRKQFIFSSSGLTVQSLLDEGILDLPHRRGTPFERGVLAGGIGTALFYITLGRNASMSDVQFMSQTSSLSKTDVSLIYGGIAASQMIRIAWNGHHANFFALPSDRGLRVGLRWAAAGG